MPRKKKTEVDKQELEEKVKEDPKSKKWNNANSRKNLRQYKEKVPDQPLSPELLTENEDDHELSLQAEEITRGRKLSPDLVKKLVPKRNILTAAERTRYNGIVTTFLSDFKNEEPTATDVDDILEIALCDIMYMRLLEASRIDPGVLMAASQSMERFHKRKAEAKKNLANRRIDRRDTRYNQDINIIDLVVRYEAAQKTSEQERIDELLKHRADAEEKLTKLIDEEEF